MILLLINSVAVYNQTTFNLIPNINIEGAMGKMEIINLSQFVSNIRYIRLETKKDVIISGISDCIFFGNQILITNLRECLLFANNGSFIRKIGSQGRGPGEYQYVVNAGADSHNKIYIQSLRDLLEYRPDGTFVKAYRNLFMFNNNLNDYFSKWIILRDSLIFGHIPNNAGNGNMKALLINKYGDIIKQYKNYDLFEIAKNSVRRSSDKEAHIYWFKNTVYYKGPNNDTLFSLDNQYNLIPVYIFNLGKYKEPVYERGIQVGKQFTNKYLSISNVFQTQNYLFICCRFGDHFPAKRLTPKVLKLPGGEVRNVWINTDMVLGVYDKRTGKMSFCSPTSTDNPLFTTGFYNDVDAGPRFFPMKQVNDSTMVMWVDSKQLKDHIASEEFKNAKPLYPEKKEELKHLADSLSEYDNPVLMFVTFKSEK